MVYFALLTFVRYTHSQEGGVSVAIQGSFQDLGVMVGNHFALLFQPDGDKSETIAAAAVCLVAVWDR